MATSAGSPTPRGTATRARILAVTADLLAENVPGAVTVSGIARSAGVYPNQITHHFGSKDRLVVDAAFLLFLRDTARLQAAGRRAATPAAFRSTLARTALAMPSTGRVVDALGLARESEPTRGRAGQLLAVVFRQSERYLDRVLGEHGWTTEHGVAREARTFWSAVFGAVLLSGGGAAGGPADVALAATLSVREADPAEPA